jgi:endogenous inhibitor of DNA gyrase (YacG/DUF329 family)
MALHNVTCEECGTPVSLSTDSGEEVVKAGNQPPGIGGLGSWSYSKNCPDCGSTVGIKVE